MYVSGFICPVCGEPLERGEKSYICPKRHSFDISAKGYVNLLTSNRMNAKLPGDNKLMVNARAAFLSKGYYSHLANALSEAVSGGFSGGVAIDAGCGEGYYTSALWDKIKEKDGAVLRGIDISKSACARAAVRFKGDVRCGIAAASIFHMPFADASADVIVSVFAPFCGDEFRRVIKKGGRLIMAIPDENHLMSLKRAAYDEPYKNVIGDYGIDGFELSDCKKTARSIFLDSNEDIQNLFAMTPYYYKTSRDGHERIKKLQSLETSAEFRVLSYKKL